MRTSRRSPAELSKKTFEETHELQKALLIIGIIVLAGAILIIRPIIYWLW